MSATADGATVVEALSGGAAESAGITAGDVITSIDGAPVTSAAAVSSVPAGHHAGDRVTVTWTTAAGAGDSATVSLGTGPAD